MDQPTSKPTAKVAAGGLAGVIVTAVVAILAAFGVVVPADVSSAALALVAAVTTIISFVAAYAKRERV
ncbi:MAG TPA: hypothetical protein VFL85_03195 [Candidatus Saccharimonadales bacterium]|nr:hypothetical protein [Candidatus Saccharimonadales bacterium]